MKPKCINSEQQKFDVKVLNALLADCNGLLSVYSAREQQIKTEEKPYGYESSKTYNYKIDKQFYSLASKSKLLRSFEQTWVLCNNISSEKHFATQLTKTKWLLYIEVVLQKAFDIDLGLKKSNILIHCPSGDDGSSVLSSLAQIIIDPYYRTFAGFKTLVYKEWLFFQHNFIKRSALLMQGQNGELVNGQQYSSVASDLKAQRL